MPRLNRARSLAFHALIFAAAGVVSCALLRRLAPFPRIAQVSEKLDAFSGPSHECDTVFIGSSKTNSGVDAPLFDAESRELGVPVVSFNLGIEGMGFPENAYFCEEVLARSAGRLRWVFVELSGIRTALDTNAETRRSLYWRDLPRTWLLCRSLLATPAPLTAEARTLLVAHLRLGLRRFLNLSDGAELLRDLLTPPPPPNPVYSSRAGFIPFRKQLPAVQVPAYLQGLALLSGERSAGDPISVEALTQFAGRIAAAGATPIFLVPPNAGPTRRFFGENPPAPVFAFDDPQRFPLLYETECRADPIHLNAAGAERFTRALAVRFVEFLENSKSK